LPTDCGGCLRMVRSADSLLRLDCNPLAGA